jgi:hypothetical protein
MVLPVAWAMSSRVRHGMPPVAVKPSHEAFSFSSQTVCFSSPTTGMPTETSTEMDEDAPIAALAAAALTAVITAWPVAVGVPKALTVLAISFAAAGVNVSPFAQLFFNGTSITSGFG